MMPTLFPTGPLVGRGVEYKLNYNQSLFAERILGKITFDVIALFQKLLHILIQNKSETTKRGHHRVRGKVHA